MFFQLYGETADWRLDSELGQHPGALVQVRAGIPAAMGSTMLTAANPMAQGFIAVLSIAVNVFVFAYILKRAKEQKKNPWKQEIFTDTKDYIEAMNRA